MAAPHPSNDTWLPQAYPTTQDTPMPLRYKIAKFENNLLATYVENRIHGDIIDRASPAPTGPPPGVYPSRIYSYDDVCAVRIQKRLLKGQLKAKQELEEERKENAKWWEENDRFWRVYTSLHEGDDVLAAQDAAHPGDAELRALIKKRFQELGEEPSDAEKRTVLKEIWAAHMEK